jgi:hypothetical protein
VSRTAWGLAALTVALVAADLALGASHVPAGTWAAHGFLGCLAIVVGSKWLGRALQRPASEPADE